MGGSIQDMQLLYYVLKFASMYSRQETSRLRQEFWTIYGKYMSPVLSAEGTKINWVNYRTGIRQIAFRMFADHQKAFAGIEMLHKDEGIQEINFNKFFQLKNIFEKTLPGTWIWKLHDQDEEGRRVSRIYQVLEPVNIFDKQDWPALISFFKEREIAFDAFWTEVKYGFEDMS
jgi:hypothetical protein